MGALQAAHRPHTSGGSGTLYGPTAHTWTVQVGATCARHAPSGWTGRRFRLGTNKEIFDAEVNAIYWALSILVRRQESVHHYTPFVDSMAAIDRIRSDSISPG